jgi:glutaryl-CoA dehydrogenase
MSKAHFDWQDPFNLDAQLNEEERMVRDTARAYAQDKLAPRVQEAFRHEKTDPSMACSVRPFRKNMAAPA